jgi:hypothetical protein
MRPSSPADLAVRTRVDGDSALVEVEATGDVSRRAQSAEARVVGPDGTARPLALRQVGPGRWSGRLDIDRSGAYLVNAAVGLPAGERPLFTQAVVSVPYPREFRSAEPDPARLEAVARRTGGRALSLGDASVNLFLDEGLPVPELMRQAWDLCIHLAAALFVIDVAVRRLSIEWRRAPVADEPRRDAARVTAAWRQARRTARGEAAVEPPPSRVDTASEVERAPARTVAVEKPSEPVKPVQPGEPEDDSPMGRLRAAKRRARGGGP